MKEITNRREAAKCEFDRLMRTVCKALEPTDGTNISDVRKVAYDIYKARLKLVEELESLERLESNRLMRQLDAPKFMYNYKSR